MSVVVVVVVMVMVGWGGGGGVVTFLLVGSLLPGKDKRPYEV